MSFIWFVLAGCAEQADSDSDSESDTDTDTNTDSDTDTDTDTGPCVPTTEVPYDGLDQDCDGSDLVDVDGDGYAAEEAGGEDCDDSDPARYPEACGDGVLTDCTRGTEDGLVTVDGATFEDLQQALDAATEGSTVDICAGTWNGPFVAALALELVGVSGADTTILDGQNAGTTLTVAPDTRITGLSLVGGSGDSSAGGLALSAPGQLSLDGCVVSGNVTASAGGGLLVPEGSTATISDTSIEDNEASEGGGLWVGEDSTVHLVGSTTVSGNTAGTGGGLSLASATLDGGIVEGNVSTDSGGGGIATTGDCSISRTEIAANQARLGAGLWIYDGLVALDDVAVHDNVASINGGGALATRGELYTSGGSTSFTGNRAETGGGLYLFDSTMSGGLLDGNQATSMGGGAYLYGSSLGAVTVTGNGSDDLGGGVYLEADSTLESTTVAFNTAPRGGGVACYGPFCALVLSDVTDNTATESGGGLLLQFYDGVVDRCTILRNTAPVGGGASTTAVGPYVAMLASIASDWGVDADDNVPDDILVGLVSVSGYGAGASFVCDDACTPAP